MRQKFVAVYDKVGECFANPVLVPTAAAAVRSFTDQVNQNGSDLNKHAEDFQLWELGTFNDNTGEMVPEKKMLIEALTVKTVIA
jgi:hypothetical protein